MLGRMVKRGRRGRMWGWWMKRGFWVGLPILRRGGWDSGAVHTKTLFWENAIHMDPENAAPENTLFWKWVSGWRNPKTQPSRSRVDGESAYFPKRWRHRPAPRLVAFDLWTPTTSHNSTTTNNSGLRARVVLQKILSPSCNLLDLITGPHKRLWFTCTSHFHLFHVVHKLNVHAPCLLLHFWRMSSATYRPGIWTTAFSVISVEPCGRTYS